MRTDMIVSELVINNAKYEKVAVRDLKVNDEIASYDMRKLIDIALHYAYSVFVDGDNYYIIYLIDERWTMMHLVDNAVFCNSAYNSLFEALDDAMNIYKLNNEDFNEDTTYKA